MVKIANAVVLINLVASTLFFLAFIKSFYNYTKTMDKSNLWLVISIAIFFSFINSISNVLEWADITVALDPAEDFLNMLITAVLAYIWFGLKQDHY